MTLSEYLARAATIPFSRGKGDCCIFVADWVLDQTGLDPADGLRGYVDDRGAMLRIGRAGGFLAMAEEAFTRHGFKKVQEARVGDVAVISVGGIYSMAIRGYRQWACKEFDGLHFGDFEPLAIWRI